jgi:hypothetical protein
LPDRKLLDSNSFTEAKHHIPKSRKTQINRKKNNPRHANIQMTDMLELCDQKNWNHHKNTSTITNRFETSEKTDHPSKEIENVTRHAMCLWPQHSKGEAVVLQIQGQPVLYRWDTVKKKKKKQKISVKI